MNHQPYEDYIFTDDLAREQSLELAQHLRTCDHCQTLAESLLTFEKRAKMSGMIGPQTGFLNRFRAQAVERQAQLQRLMVRRFLLFLGVANVITLAMVVGFVFISKSPAKWLISLVSSISELFVWANVITKMVNVILQILPPIIPFLFWVSMTCTLSILAIFWAFYIWRFATQGVKQ